MTNTLNKELLTTKLGITTKILGNKRTSYSNMNYLTVYADEGKLWYQALGDGHELLIPVSDFEGDAAEVNINSGQLGRVLKALNDDVTITIEDSGVAVTDGTANAKLANYVLDADMSGTAVTREERLERIAATKANGHELPKKEFLDVLGYLHGLRGRDASDELMEDIYFTDDYAFIFDARFVVRLTHDCPIPLVLNSDTADILLTFLKGTEGDVFYVNRTAKGLVEFVAGDSYYGVKGLTTYIKDISSTMNSFTPEEEVKVGLNEFIRFIDLATIFLEDGEEDVMCTMDGGEGRILSNTQNNSSDGIFSAEGVDGVKIGMNAFDILTIIGALKGTVSDELELSLNLTEEKAYFKHDKGDCLLAIKDHIDD